MSNRRTLVPAVESAVRQKLFTEVDATKQLDLIAPEWPLHLNDGIVIDHILEVINQTRTSRAEIMRRYRARRGAGRSTASPQRRP